MVLSDHANLCLNFQVFFGPNHQSNWKHQISSVSTQLAFRKVEDYHQCYCWENCRPQLGQMGAWAQWIMTGGDQDCFPWVTVVFEAQAVGVVSNGVSKNILQGIFWAGIRLLDFTIFQLNDQTETILSCSGNIRNMQQ